MKGHVPTPIDLADHMVRKLFSEHEPESGDRVLYPGLGEGPFAQAVHRYCEESGLSEPKGIGIEQDPEHLETARENLAEANVEIRQENFLGDLDIGKFNYVIANPPYVPIEGLSEEEKSRYRREFETAVERFDLFALFFERSLSLLADDGRLVFVTPEKFEYTSTTAPLRRLMATFHIEEIEHAPEDQFSGYITYPTITTVHDRDAEETRIIRRDGSEDTVVLPKDGSSWASTIRETGIEMLDSPVTLEDVTVRVSCGVATGDDSLFVMEKEDVPNGLEKWTFPTTSGGQLRENDGPDSGQVFLCPYDMDGNLIPEGELGDLGEWFESHRDRLEDRSCVENGKKWYAWHETPPMQDLYGVPKILCKDVSAMPQFWADREGDVVPRHSVYYIVPKAGVDLDLLLEYLNGGQAKAWIEAHAQKAHNDYLRLQSTTLKQLPVPEELADRYQATLV